MFAALIKAIRQLSDPYIQKIVFLGAGLTALVFIALWSIITFLLITTSFFETSWLEWLIDLMGGAFALALAWLLFPSVISAVVGFFLEPVINAVDACYYPELPAPRARPLSEVIIHTLRFLCLMVSINVFLLLFLLILLLISFFCSSVKSSIIG